MKAIGYTRVSTDEQLAGGGLEIQQQAIRKFCRDNKTRLVDIATDAGISGSNGLDKRLGLAAALVRLEAGEAECLVVYRLDRLARDFVLQEMLMSRLNDAGTPVLSVTEPDVDTISADPTKVLIRQILGSLGQYERALIRARMEAGKVLKAARGGYVGGQPGYGMKAVNAELALEHEESDIVNLVLSLRSQGRSYREICVALDSAGFKPRRAARWHPMVVRSIAQRRLS
jgi:DNA invertase Pin-like site-specific DNA recombinase